MVDKKITISELWQKVDFTKFSTLSLIFSNILVLVFAIIDELSALSILRFYWMQSVIIGIFNFITILNLKEFSTEGFKRGNKQQPANDATKRSTAFFFLFHYGLFHFVYAQFLGVFSQNSYLNSDELNFFTLSAVMFFITSMFEYINAKNEQGDKLPNIGKLMFAPYTRIIPMHIIIIVGGFISAAGAWLSTDTNLLIIILFVSLKTFVDMLSQVYSSISQS